MKLLKLIPAAAIALTAFTSFEAKAGFPSGWTKKNQCTFRSFTNWTYYKLQKTGTPASYGVYGDRENEWIKENVSYDEATKKYKDMCDGND